MHERLGSIFDKSLDPAHISKVSSVILIVIFFAYLFKIASLFQLSIYVFWQRTTHISDFYANSFVSSSPIDNFLILFLTSLWIFLCVVPLKSRAIISLGYFALGIIESIYSESGISNIVPAISLPLIASLLITSKILVHRTGAHLVRAESNTFFFSYFLLVSLILGIIAGVIFAIFSNNNSEVLLPNYAFDIYLLISLLSPILLLALSFSAPLKILMNEIGLVLRRVLNHKSDSKSRRNFEVAETTEQVPYLSLSWNRTLTVGCILGCLILSMIIAMVPHLRIIESSEVIGVDTGYYSVSIKNIVSKSNTTSEAIAETFSYDKADRPFVLLLLYLYSLALNSDDSKTLDFLPLVLSPALVLAVYFLTREISSNRLSPIFAAFFTAVSGQVLAGIYAGFYANWIALIIGFSCLALMISYLRRPTILKALVFSGLILLLLLSHTYTWSIFLLVMIIFLIISYRRKYYYSRKSTAILFIPLLFSVVFDISRALVIGVDSAIEGNMDVAEVKGAGLNQFSERWNNLIRTAQSYLGGLLGNFIILALAVYWLFIADLRRPGDIFILVFLSVGILPLFFGDVVILSRTLYEIPYQIPAAISMAHILSVNAFKRSRILLISTVSVWLLVIAITNIANVTPVVLAE